VADKLLLVTVFVCLSIAGLVPWWLAALVLLRDLVILFGALTYKWVFGPLRGAPTAASKFNTLCQIVFCLAVVARAAFGVVGDAVVTALGALATVSTAVSGIDYTLIYARRAAVVSRERAPRRVEAMQQLALRVRLGEAARFDGSSPAPTSRW